MTIIKESVYKPFRINRLWLSFKIQENLIRITFVSMRKFPSKKVIVIQLNTLNFKCIRDANRFFLTITRIIWNMVKIRLAQIIHNIDLIFFIVMIIAYALTVIHTPHLKQILFFAIRSRYYYTRFFRRTNRVKR